MRWKNAERCTTDEHVMIYSGHKTEHKHGVGVLLSKQVAKSMMGFHALSDRILIVKIASKPFNIVVVQVYAPTSTSTEDEIEKFYDDLEVCRRQESSGRQRKTYLTYLQKMKENTPIELIHLTRDRGVWSELSNSSLRQHDMAPW